MILKCSEPDGCPCKAHIDTAFYVPCCSTCRVPLVPTDPPEPDHGVCPQQHCPTRGRIQSHKEWAWLHQDTLADDDLPPWNGWEPIDLEAVQ